MKIKLILTLTALSMLAVSCDFFSGTVYLNDSVYLCNHSSDCPPNNVCVGFHIQWDATGDKPKTNSVYSGYYGSCISESDTNTKVYACDNGTFDKSDDLCNDTDYYKCQKYATPVCPESLKNSCGNGVKDYNEECEYDYHHKKMYEDEFIFGQGIHCGNFFYNLEDQSNPETNYRLFAFSNDNGDLYCNPNCKLNTVHCDVIHSLPQIEFEKHLKHSSFACEDQDAICSGPHTGICRDSTEVFETDISKIIPIYNNSSNIGIKLQPATCSNPQTPYCENPVMTLDGETHVLGADCVVIPPSMPLNCNNGELNIEEPCDGNEFNLGFNNVKVDAVCDNYGYIAPNEENQVTCNQCRLNFDNCEPDQGVSSDLGSPCIPGQDHCAPGLVCKNFIKGKFQEDFQSHLLLGGYCTTDMPEVCNDKGGTYFPDFNICLNGCSKPDDNCREGYKCEPFDNSLNFCIPNTIDPGFF